MPSYLKKIKSHVDEEYAALHSLSDGKVRRCAHRTPARPIGCYILVTYSTTRAHVCMRVQEVANCLCYSVSLHVPLLLHTQDAGQNTRMQPLSEPERAELLAGLKKKWEEAHKQYQRLTFNIDTTAKTQKKEGLEVWHMSVEGEEFMEGREGACAWVWMCPRRVVCTIVWYVRSPPPLHFRSRWSALRRPSRS